METNPARFGYRQRFDVESDQRAIAPLETHSLGMEKRFSTNTEPCINDCPFNHQSGEHSVLPPPGTTLEDFLQIMS